MSSRSSKPFSFRILFVDDEPAIVETAALILGQSGYEVHTARDGFEALTALSRSLPDIQISDLSMPNMSGFELLSSGAAAISSIACNCGQRAVQRYRPHRFDRGRFFQQGSLQSRTIIREDTGAIGTITHSAQRQQT